MRPSRLKVLGKRFGRAQRGNAGVEFALLLPILMLLLFGGIEIGRALHDYQVINEAVRDAARYMSRVPGVDCQSEGVGTGDFLNVVGEPFDAQQHKDRARALAMTGDVDTAPNLLGYWDYATQASSDTIRVDCIDNPPAVIRAFQGLYANDDYVPHVVLTANVPFTFLFGGLVTSDPTITITLSHNVAVIGL